MSPGASLALQIFDISATGEHELSFRATATLLGVRYIGETQRGIGLR
jgi:hypothetical protein